MRKFLNSLDTGTLKAHAIFLVGSLLTFGGPPVDARGVFLAPIVEPLTFLLAAFLLVTFIPHVIVILVKRFLAVPSDERPQGHD